MTLQALRREAEGEAARLPALLAEARRLAATVQAGAHARRREGAGEGFWSYRPYRPGDEPRRIDWRRSARGDEVVVREVEEARAATVWLWPDRRPGMRWRSAPGLPLKSERAVVLALALASLLGRGGERCGLLGGGMPAATGGQAAERLAEGLAGGAEDAGPPAVRGTVVLLSDCLEEETYRSPSLAGGQAPEAPGGDLRAPSSRPSGPPDEVREATSPAKLGRGAEPISGVLLRIADPAEVDFPYAGRLLFAAPGSPAHRRFGRAEAVRADYAAARAAHFAAVDAAAAHAGLRVLVHRTDQPAATALLALWRAVAGVG